MKYTLFPHTLMVELFKLKHYLDTIVRWQNSYPVPLQHTTKCQYYYVTMYLTAHYSQCASIVWWTDGGDHWIYDTLMKVTDYWYSILTFLHKQVLLDSLRHFCFTFLIYVKAMNVKARLDISVLLS